MTMRLTARIAPAVVAAVLLAGCGSDDDPTAGSIDPPSGTTVPASDGGGDADDLRAPTPIEVVGGGGGTGVGEATAAEPATDAATSEMRIAPWVVEFSVAPGMPALPTDATGYVYDAAGPATAEQVSALAAALSVAGEPQRLDDESGGGWRVGPDDGSAASLWVGDDGQLSWNHGAAWAVDRPLAECVVSVDADGTESSDCPEPEPPTGVPSAEEAEQRAADLMVALGFDPATLTFEVYADEWFASVDVSQRTAAGAAFRTWGFGFGAEGVLQYANGSLASPAPVGPYPLIGIDEAVARLSEPFFGVGVARAEPAVDVIAEPLPEDTGGVEETTGATLPVDSTPTETVVIELVDVVADLWWAWDVDGAVHLLPAYRFIDRDGGWHTTPAVTADFLIQVDPGVTIEPMPVETLPVETLPVESVPVETLPVETVPVESVPVDPGSDPEGALPTLEQWVGLSLEEFTANAETIGFTTRVVQLDGEFLAGTADYRTDRVNVVVVDARVSAIDSIG